MTCIKLLSLLGLLFGVISSALMYYFPPTVTVYTEDGDQHVNWITGNTSEENRRKAKRQIIFSKIAPVLLGMSFVLQFISISLG